MRKSSQHYKRVRECGYESPKLTEMLKRELSEAFVEGFEQGVRNFRLSSTPGYIEGGDDNYDPLMEECFPFQDLVDYAIKEIIESYAPTEEQEHGAELLSRWARHFADISGQFEDAAKQILKKKK